MTFGKDPKAGGRITSLDEFNKCLDYFQSQGYNEVCQPLSACVDLPGQPLVHSNARMPPIPNIS